jgi:hypothetical protein
MMLRERLDGGEFLGSMASMCIQLISFDGFLFIFELSTGSAIAIEMLNGYKACTNDDPISTDDDTQICRNFSGGANVMTADILRDLVITAFVIAVLESPVGSYLTYCESSVEKEVGAKMEAPHPFESKEKKEARIQNLFHSLRRTKLRHLKKLQNAAALKGLIPFGNWCLMVVAWYHGAFEGTDETTFLLGLFSSVVNTFRFGFKYGDPGNNKEYTGANRFGGLGNVQRNPVAVA